MALQAARDEKIGAGLGNVWSADLRVNVWRRLTSLMRIATRFMRVAGVVNAKAWESAAQMVNERSIVRLAEVGLVGNCFCL